MILKCNKLSGDPNCAFNAEGTDRDQLVSELSKHITAVHPDLMGEWSEDEMAAMQDFMLENIED